MIDWKWITTATPPLLMIFLSGIGIYVALMLFTRLTGLRSFSKMSSFDFAITVAFGSVMASTLLTNTPSLVDGTFALAVLFGIQYTVSRLRQNAKWVEKVVDNRPLVVMAGDNVLEDHMSEARLTIDDLRSHLRLAGVTHPKQVFAVVFETTGEVSVLKKGDGSSPWLFEDIRGSNELNFNQ